MYKVFDISLAALIILGAGIAMIAAWVFTVILSLIPFILRVGIIAAVLYVFLKLFGVL